VTVLRGLATQCHQCTNGWIAAFRNCGLGRSRSSRASRECRRTSCSFTFRRLEDRGEVRGGELISELIGEQFALPVAVDSLRGRTQRRSPARS
jgi:ATP-dependent Lhr-like helicase